MLWACILLPQLALDGVQRDCPELDQPLALLGGPAQRRVLQAVNPAARALGLKPGLSWAAAQLLSTDFTARDYDPARIDYWQQFLAAWAYRFSSQVSLHFPRALLLEVQSSMALFGPWPAFEARLRAELRQLGFTHRICLAAHPLAARMLANAYDGFHATDPDILRQAVERLPVGRVGLPPEAATSLQRMGLRSVGQVLAMPRQQLARRFPATVLHHLDCLTGARPLALQFFAPPDVFDQRIELNFDVESHQALLFPLRRLINDLSTYLSSRDGGVQRFVVLLEHAQGAPSEVPVGLLAAERDAELLFEFARGRLESLQVPRPVRNVRLLAEDLPRFVPACKQLFDPRAHQAQPWEQLRERIRARLGEEALHELHAHADHRPERAWRRQPGVAPEPLPAVLRPGWLLREVEPLDELTLQIIAGPERIESGWWDGGDVRRDYYRIQTLSGRQAWAYRTVGKDEPMQIQGWFS